MQNNKVLSDGVWLNHRPICIKQKIPDAEIPHKELPTDVMYNITIVQRTENRTEDFSQDVNAFNTGLVITPSLNYHVEIFPHPQLHKAGYLLVGPIVIGHDNEEELVLNLYKFKDSPDLELPYTAAIMLTRETEYCSLQVEGKQKVEEHKGEKVAKGKSVKGKGNHLF